MRNVTLHSNSRNLIKKPFFFKKVVKIATDMSLGHIQDLSFVSLRFATGPSIGIDRGYHYWYFCQELARDWDSPRAYPSQ